jgi:hypothetical protein
VLTIRDQCGAPHPLSAGKAECACRGRGGSHDSRKTCKHDVAPGRPGGNGVVRACPSPGGAREPGPRLLPAPGLASRAMGNANVPAGRNGWENWQAADYVANGALNAALNEAAENPKEGYCWYASIVDALYPWTQYKTSTGATPFTNLFGNADITMAGKWLGASESAMLAAIAAGPGTGSVSINGYLNSLNFGPTRNTGGVALTDTSFTVAANGTVMVRLAGRTEATTFSPIALAGLAYNNGWTDVVTIKASPPPQPTLWWTTSFHAMAIAGLSGPNQLLVADPDSVPINAMNSNGGWWNFAGIKSAATLAGKNAAATASLASAVAAVKANIYTNAQEAGPTPVPGAGLYTAANLYGSITLSATAGQQNQITAASNATYGGKTMVSSFDVINTLAMTRKSIAPMAMAAPGGGATPVAYKDTFEWTGEIAEDVEQIEIFPVVALADSTFTFTAPGWSESLITTDPFGGIWAGGRRRPERDVGRFGPGAGRDRRHDARHDRSRGSVQRVLSAGGRGLDGSILWSGR